MLKIFNQKVARQSKMEAEKEIPAFQSLDQFNVPSVIDTWMGDGHQPTLVVVRKAGTGKTSFIRMLFYLLKKKMLVLNHREDFKKYNDGFDVTFYDGFCFDDLTRDELCNWFVPCS